MVLDHHDLGGDYMALGRLYPLLRNFTKTELSFADDRCECWTR